MAASIASVDNAPEVEIPEEYADFKDIFEDKEISTLPPHRPYDHEIKLIPGTSPIRADVQPI